MDVLENPNSFVSTDSGYKRSRYLKAPINYEHDININKLERELVIPLTIHWFMEIIISKIKIVRKQTIFILKEPDSLLAQ